MTWRRTGVLAALGSVLWGTIPLGASAQAPAAPPSLEAARLQGRYLLKGRVSKATAVRGEHVGQRVVRTWTFASGCTAGPCATVSLARSRATGTDKLVLHRRASAFYSGSGSFYGPLRCGKHTFRRGEKILFTISVRITAATASNGVVVATGVRALYNNRSRVNLTRCFAVLGHDAASYNGQLVAS